MNNQLRGSFLVALSGTLYGMLGFFGTQLLHANFSICSMLFWRFFIASLWIIASASVLKINLFNGIKLNSSVLTQLVIAILSYACSSFFYFMSSQYVGTGIAMVIFFSFPIFVILFAWLFNNWRMNKYTLGSLLMVILGLFFLKGKGGDALSLMGILLSGIASLSYAIYVYSSQFRTKDIDTRLQTLLICIGNSFVFLVITLKEGSLTMPNTFHAWVYLLALGIVATALPIQLLLDGLRYVSAIKAAILSVLEPAVTVIVGVMLLQEFITMTQFLGIIIVLMGAIFSQFEKS